MLQAEMARADSHFGKSLLALSFPWQFNTKEENESFTRENCTGASLHSCPSGCGQQCKDNNIKQTNGQIYVSDIQRTSSDRSNPSQKASMQKASLRASSQPQSTGSMAALSPRAGQELWAPWNQHVSSAHSSSACSAARLAQVPKSQEQQYSHWFHQGKNGPATSQDLFKTEEKAFFTDIMKYIGMEKDTEGVLSEVQRLWSCYFHHDATGELSRKEEGKGALLSSAWDLAWEAEHTLPVPSVDEEWRQCICSPCIQKAQNRCEIALVSLQRTGYHLASSYVAFLLLKTCQKIICQ